MVIEAAFSPSKADIARAVELEKKIVDKLQPVAMDTIQLTQDEHRRITKLHGEQVATMAVVMALRNHYAGLLAATAGANARTIAEEVARIHAEHGR